MKKRWLFALIIISVFLVSFLIGKLMLYWNFLLGNDTVITLEVDKEHSVLTRGQNDTLTVEASILSNMFCDTMCEAEWTDLSEKRTIESLEFNLSTGQPFIRNYWLYPGEKGEGYRLYRFSMECKSEKSFLCHTGEEPTRRSALIVVDYRLDTEEAAGREKGDLANRLSVGHARLLSLAKQSSATIAGLKTIKDEPLLLISRDLDNRADIIAKRLSAAQEHWAQQDYVDFSNSLDGLEELLNTSIAYGESQMSSLDILIMRYRNAKAAMESSSNSLVALQGLPLTNSTIAGRISRATRTFIGEAEDFSKRTSIAEKESIADSIQKLVNDLNLSVRKAARSEYISRAIELEAMERLLAEVSNTTIPITTRPEDLQAACARADDLARYADSLAAENQSFDARSAVHNLLGKTYAEMLLEAEPGTERHDALLTMQRPYDSINITDEQSFISAILSIIPRCRILSVEFVNASIDFAEEAIAAHREEEPQYYFEQHARNCALFGEDMDCCEDCLDSSRPVLLLHGHAFDKAISYEYSLEGWSKVQSRLEEYGILNGGTINVYGPDRMPDGALGRFDMPVSFRSSYYFDVYTEPGSFALVQSKSENIDTYAIRVKEIVSRVKAKTGKDKVDIVAFSMGGLVARRYLQIFGDSDVGALVLLGVPNHGISGRVRSLCDVRGSPIECRDMDEDSLFMKKLSGANLPNIPITNIVARGCDMEGEDGDGIVLLRSSVLEGIENIVVNGTCRHTTAPLHIDLLDPDMYPEVYESIKLSLRG